MATTLRTYAFIGVSGVVLLAGALGRRQYQRRVEAERVAAEALEAQRVADEEEWKRLVAAAHAHGVKLDAGQPLD